MKILELRFKNLNSIYGEWLIDFTQPDFVSDGIFALTGPTGAGKSTILDAICLALYGATPRLGRITSSSNEIMSRKTGECFAEVLFESQQGRFRSHWEQRRARKSADGKLQEQEHQISDADSGKIIESKKSKVAAVIEAKTGMDFDRFTRSILLAQGGFDTFLKADPEQKSKILEQITGTQIYSDISRRVHERQREEREILARLKAETAGISLLSADEIKADIELLQVNQQKVHGLSLQLSESDNAIRWLTHVSELQMELTELAVEAEGIHQRVVAFAPERDSLAAANKAMALEGDYATLAELRKQQAQEAGNAAILQQSLLVLIESSESSEVVLHSAEEKTAAAKAALEAAKPLLQHVRGLDHSIADKNSAITAQTASCQHALSKIEADKQSLHTLQQQQIAMDAEVAALQQYFKRNASDEWLVSGLAGIEQQLLQLRGRQQELARVDCLYAKADDLLAKNLSAVTRCEQLYAVEQASLASASALHQQCNTALLVLLAGKLLREYQADLRSAYREMALQTKIVELEDRRSKLEDGKPCPLCGAEEHPFAAGNIPSFDETEQRIAELTALINKAEALEAELKGLDSAVSAAKQSLQLCENQLTAASSEVKAAEKTKQDWLDQQLRLRVELTGLTAESLAKLTDLGVTELPVDIDVLLTSLRDRLAMWQVNEGKLSTINSKLNERRSDVTRLQAVIETQVTGLSDQQKRLDALKSDADRVSAERHTAFGDALPDIEERKLYQAITVAEASEKQHRLRHSETVEELNSVNVRLRTLQTSIEARTDTLLLAEERFTDALAATDFADEKHFLTARLTSAQREALARQAQQLDALVADNGAKTRDREARLDQELQKKITDKSLAELALAKKTTGDELRALGDRIAAGNHRLAENDKALSSIADKQADIEAQQKEFTRWEKLHGLIGSADGKRYRNFAQGLTFELMVSHANRQLEKMTDRYLLMRDNKEPLSLNVIDNYQAGEIRSTKNLSGGESFIISLTLALGLSAMASRKVRVDSLFLDEGFGTLDEEALDTALETLSGLQQEGKLIGVISHIPALKQRISTQISIVPASGGKSKLVGPGCRMVEG